jgi:hypothetical protein
LYIFDIIGGVIIVTIVKYNLIAIYEKLDGPTNGQCAWRAIAEAKQRSQRSVIRWVTKIYYLELLRASEGTLNRWSWLHLQSLALTPVSRRVDVRQAAAPVVKIIAESLSQHDENFVPTPLSVGKG